jgi:hypothetical protein
VWEGGGDVVAEGAEGFSCGWAEWDAFVCVVAGEETLAFEGFGEELL